jgi:hypothetical protein
LTTAVVPTATPLIAVALLAGCSSDSGLQSYLGDRYQPTGATSPDREFRTSLPFSAVDAAVTNQYEPLESIRAGDGTFHRYDDDQYLSIVPSGAGSTILLGSAAGLAASAFRNHGGSAVAEERGGGPGEGK